MGDNVVKSERECHLHMDHSLCIGREASDSSLMTRLSSSPLSIATSIFSSIKWKKTILIILMKLDTLSQASEPTRELYTSPFIEKGPQVLQKQIEGVGPEKLCL